MNLLYLNKGKIIVYGGKCSTQFEFVWKTFFVAICGHI